MAEVVRATLSRLPKWSARFVAYRGLISGGRIKPGAFKPLPNPRAGGRLECSVTLHEDVIDQEVIQQGRRFAGGLNPPRTFLGWVDLPTNEIPKVINNGVYVERSPSRGNPAHANILGIPDPNSEEWRLVALQLVKLATPLITAP
ncbi:MAG TPA: hypothetical protein IAC79_01400 [Candidatus Spyradenecus faecavium]|uniref:Uncharacterized protein n=1 Tax=Candidatus Spyradenecus faecavium TaxID=2840947 RepID=A0A9D1T1U5_9BACT|nr:hypothetical protein [Candidatus Spyradenecus faecavium]